MLALLAKYKLMVVAAALLGALPLSLSAALGQPSSHVGHARPGAAAHGKRGPHGGLIHGSIITSVNGASVTYTLDAGQVTSASASAITLKRADGQSVTLTITANTIWGNHHAAPKDYSKLQGRTIVVFSQNGDAVQVGRGNGVLKNAVHLDVTVTRNGKTRTIQIDRGAC